MSGKKNDGGSAFARQYGLRPRSLDKSDYAEVPAQPGMSLRDYFAAAALTRYSAEYAETNSLTRYDVAARCYLYADAMIAERDK